MKSKLNIFLRGSLLLGVITALTLGLIFIHVPQVIGQPIKIGVLYSTTGTMAPFESFYREGALLAIEQTNQAGGILGRKIEVFDYDAESNSEVAGRKAMKLVQMDGVVSVIGPGTAYVFGGMVSTIGKLETPFIIVNGILQTIQPQPKWVFTTELQNTNWFIPAGAFMKKKGIKSLVLLSSADRVGESAVQCLQLVEEKFGVKFIAHELRPISDTEFSATWAKLLTNKPDAAFINASPPSFVTPGVNNLYDLGFKSLLFYVGGGRLRSMMKGLTKVGGESLRLVNPKYLGWDQLPSDDPDRERVQSFAKAFIAKYKKDPEIAAFGYDGAKQILDAIKAVGPDRAKIRDYLEKMKGWEGALGMITNRSPEDHAGNGWRELPMYSWDAVSQRFKIEEFIKIDPYNRWP